MNTETITYPTEHGDISLTVSAATIKQGMTRTRLKIEAQAVTETDPDVLLLRRFTYPDVISATTTASGLPWPLPFDDYLNLPDALGAQWEEAVYRLNPGWLPATEPDDSEKKAP